MSASRRLTAGRSPLVRKQSQITSFFTPGKSPNPSPNPTSNLGPSPLQSEQLKQKKPRLVIPPSPAVSSLKTPPSALKNGVLDGVVGKRIKIFWPLDGAWYEGRVMELDENTGKHLVKYDDGEEERLELAGEKFELIEDEGVGKRRRRLRRMSDSMDISMCQGGLDVDEENSGDDGDSVEDEDWGKGLGKKELDDDDSEEVELDEDEDEEIVLSSRSGRASNSSASKRRKKIDVAKLDCAKKVKFEADTEKSPPKICSAKTESSLTRIANGKERNGALEIKDVHLSSEAVDRFGKREAEKFWFLGKGRKDAAGRSPGHEKYDPRTLYLPHQFLKSLSDGQRQWWEFKSKHMDKVLFFKMGKFYELYEMDAHIGAKELDLQYMKGEQPHCGFPEKNFAMNLEKLVQKGYRVLVVEQTETPEQLEIRRREKGSKDKVVKREICAVVSKGTLTEGESLLMNPDTSYLLSITENCQDVGVISTENRIIGLCLIDVSTGKFILGQFEDDLERHCLCSILSQFRPVEIIRPSGILSSETARVLKNNIRSPLVNELLPSTEFWDADKAIIEITKYFNTSNNLASKNGDFSTDFESLSREMPDLLVELTRKNQSYALSALGGCLYYLRQSFLDETLMKCAKFEMLPCLGSYDATQNEYMILDATALENLEILENNQNGGQQGTLFAQLDHCVTAFGKRLLKRWLARPLYDTKSIQERQDAVACFKGPGLSSAIEFRKELSRLPDIERLLSRIFSRCKSLGRNNSKVVLYEDASKKQLQEFLACLRGCDVVIRVLDSFRTIIDSTDSMLLRRLLAPGIGHPEMSSIIEHFKEAFDWLEADKNGRIIPHEGVDAEYDAACERVKEIESGLTTYLKEQRIKLGNKGINYVTIGKDMYLLEVPESLRGAVPGDYELQSSKKGFFRYWTPRIIEDLSELSQAEAEKETALKGILQRLIEQFSDRHNEWRQMVSVTAELDVLISFSIASDYYEGPACRPIIREICHSNDDCPYLSAKGLGHPLLRSDALGKGTFVPNDVRIGGLGCAKFILITGPNMGGKSTLIRQVCLAVILAQIGADVPAERFELSPVDHIFVRMGASDHIMSGQSTFLVELSETASILSAATRNSLVALDELGRGTSTSDGQAIAASVFEYLNHKVRCRGLFSTHYHSLAQEYEKDTNVYLGHMACQVGKGLDGVEEVTFLYKLTPGSCPRSYGVNVARLAGIPSSVLQNASKKSIDVENSFGKHRCGAKRRIQDRLIDQEIALMKDLISVANSVDEHPTVSLSLLCDKQKKAKLLLAGS